jgi:hypothetical protein
MTANAAEIETIIRVVLERLRQVDAAPSAAANMQPAAPVAAEANAVSRVVPVTAPSAASLQSAANRLRLELPLITLEQLRSNLSGIQVLEVPRRAVVTPAVLDELRQRGVKLQRLSPHELRQSSSTQSSPSLMLVAPAGIVKQQGAGAKLVEDADSQTTLHTISEHVFTPGHGVVWCSPRPFAAAMAIRGQAQLRAVQLTSLSDLKQAVAEAQPNLLIVDPRQWSAPAIANLLRTWKVTG